MGTRPAVLRLIGGAQHPVLFMARIRASDVKAVRKAVYTFPLIAYCICIASKRPAEE
jgi:hypothetical protein